MGVFVPKSKNLKKFDRTGDDQLSKIMEMMNQVNDVAINRERPGTCQDCRK